MQGASYYQIAGTIAAGAADNAAICQLRANVATRLMFLVTLEIELTSVVATQVALVRPTTAAGVPTVASTFAGQRVWPRDIAQAAPVGQLITAFDVLPTYAAGDLPERRSILSAIGSRIVWSWPEEAPLIITNGVTWTLRNVTGALSGSLNVSARWFE